MLTQKLKLIKSHFSAQARSGFTLLEILLVLSLLGIVASFVFRNVFSSAGKGKINATQIIIKQLQGDLDRYRLDCNRYPTTEQTLSALVTAPQAAPLCKNYDPSGYLGGKKKAPTDAWGNDLSYESDGRTYVVKSLGRDGIEGGEGEDKDISSNEE